MMEDIFPVRSDETGEHPGLLAGNAECNIPDLVVLGWPGEEVYLFDHHENKYRIPDSSGPGECYAFDPMTAFLEIVISDRTWSAS